MRLLMLILCVAFSPAAALAADPPEWYAIEHSPEKCKKDAGPADFFSAAQTAGYEYSAHDTTDPATRSIIETTIDVPAMGSSATFYRGKDRCEAALAGKKAGEKADTDRYQ